MKITFISSHPDDAPEHLKKFARRWHAGSTCATSSCKRNDVYLYTADEDWVVIKHHGHAEYVDRVIKTTRCKTAYYLYHINDDPAFGNPARWCVEGRWRAHYLDEICDVIKDAENE